MEECRMGEGGGNMWEVWLEDERIGEGITWEAELVKTQDKKLGSYVPVVVEGGIDKKLVLRPVHLILAFCICICICICICTTGCQEASLPWWRMRVGSTQSPSPAYLGEVFAVSLGDLQVRGEHSPAYLGEQFQWTCEPLRSVFQQITRVWINVKVSGRWTVNFDHWHCVFKQVWKTLKEFESPKKCPEEFEINARSCELVGDIYITGDNGEDLTERVHGQPESCAPSGSWH